MVFDKNVDRAKIEQFENLILEKVSNSEFVTLLKNELKKKHLKFAIHIQHTEPDFKKYCSHLVIDIHVRRSQLQPGRRLKLRLPLAPHAQRRRTRQQQCQKYRDRHYSL